jgi:hypothetical protein
LKQLLIKNNALANELTYKFQSLIGEFPLSSHYEKEDGVEKFKIIASKVEVSFGQLRQENQHMKERVTDLLR